MIKINEVIIVEGKYDAITLSNVIDGLIITTDGFKVFSDNEKKELIKELGKKRGLVVLTDSDSAGFKIRNYINKIASGFNVKNVYIPSILGKETRKTESSKEGLLGVEGVSKDILLDAFAKAGINTNNGKKTKNEITYTSLYQLGISGTQGSIEKRRKLLNEIGLPIRLSKNALLQVLNTLYSLEELKKIIKGNL